MFCRKIIKYTLISLYFYEDSKMYFTKFKRVDINIGRKEKYDSRSTSISRKTQKV